jgi:hypothetical protein
MVINEIDEFSVLESPEYDHRFRWSGEVRQHGWDEDVVLGELRLARIIKGKLCVSDRARRRLSLQPTEAPIEGTTTFWWPVGDCEVGVEFRAMWWKRRHERNAQPRRSQTRMPRRTSKATKLAWTEEV